MKDQCNSAGRLGVKVKGSLEVYSHSMFRVPGHHNTAVILPTHMHTFCGSTLVVACTTSVMQSTDRKEVCAPVCRLFPGQQ